MEKFERNRLATLLLLLLITILSWFPFTSNSSSSCECLTVSFLDVGQGDAILIQTPDGYEMLIDGGRDSSVLRELSKQRLFFDRTIDVVVSTHPDLDHVAGLVDVLQRYQVGTIVMTTNEGESGAAEAFSDAVPTEGAQIVLADAGQIIALGAQVVVQIFAPTGDEAKLESNTASIVTRIVY